MSFDQDMQAMSADQVRDAVGKRLLKGQGVPWADSMGEPVWALLQSAFDVWRLDPDQLSAFDQGLHETLGRAIKGQNWTAVQSSCELVLSLASNHAAWRPDALAQWPLSLWLKQTQPSNREHALAWATLLELAELAGWRDSEWIKDQFKWVVNTIASQPHAVDQYLPWLHALWAWLTEDPQQTSRQWPWSDIWQSLSRIDDEKARLRSADVVMMRARDRLDKSGAKEAIYALRLLDRPDFEKQVMQRMPLHWTNLPTPEGIPSDADATLAYSRAGPDE
ncbi:MAG: hypothetical protein QM520_06135 [Gammaproteobacteria bacterium]|nr:hypothetical protein [Gammaproteobacteria bacterium]